MIIELLLKPAKTYLLICILMLDLAVIGDWITKHLTAVCLYGDFNRVQLIEILFSALKA